MSNNYFLKLSFLTLIFTFGTNTSFACMYGPPYRTVCQHYTQANTVVIGKIESVNGDNAMQTVVIKVEKTFKGQHYKKIVLHQPQSTCDWNFSNEVGKTLLLYLVRDNKTKKYSALAQGAGGEVERENDDLYWLNNLPKSLHRTRLSGTVTLYEVNPFVFVKNVSGIKVKVFNSNHSFEVSTDKNGIYEVWNIPPGKYQIEPLIPPDLKIRLDIEKGLVDFDSLKKNNPNTSAVLIEIQSNTCGGIDFVLYEKNSK